jgi:hypothetical protein
VNAVYAAKRWAKWDTWGSAEVALWLREHEHMTLSLLVETLQAKGVKKPHIEMGFTTYIAQKT